jgi:transcriptional regulator with GAF, ATPase, and Fis domain
VLFQRFEDDWFALIETPAAAGEHRAPSGVFARFTRDLAHFLPAPARSGAEPPDAAHLFALGYQARRAFHYVFRYIFGGSLPAARLRAAVWQSVFTHDAAAYRAELYARLGDIPTLIVGESGTGKELVARAIALSRYIPFDPRSEAFAADPARCFAAVNLSALSPTLIESELFGHRRGAFTGAAEDRAGWLESCDPCGAVFLDEIGELDAAVQVKLLRVMQAREFQRIGEIQSRRFAGKVIAATNRNLAEEIAAGRFREDFYYRLCGDVIATPALRDQLAETPGELRNLLRIVAADVAGAAHAERVAEQAETWVRAQLGADYPWPGNMRELAQHRDPRRVRAAAASAHHRGGGAPHPHRRRARPTVLRQRARADRQLSGNRPAARARPAHRPHQARRLGPPPARRPGRVIGGPGRRPAESFAVV